MSDEALSLTAQEDMRNLLGLLRDYLKEVHPALFEKAEVLITPSFALIHVPIGPVPKEDAPVKDHDDYSLRQTKVVAAFYAWHQQSYLTGTPLMQYLEPSKEGEAVLAKYHLIPNDILSAEKDMKTLLARLRKTHYENQA